MRTILSWLTVSTMVPTLVDSVNHARETGAAMQTRATATTSAFARRYGPWALVTGASDGIGREFVTQLAARGLNVVLVARRAAMLEALSAELVAHQHVSCRVVPLDLAQPHSVDRLVAATSDLDIGLVVAAAGFGTSGRLIDAPLTAEVELLTVNCAAVLEMTWHYGRRLAERGRGGIVLMSSLLGFAGVPQAANYAATKAYIQSLAEGLSREFAPMGVDVISSAPGPVHSGFRGSREYAHRRRDETRGGCPRNLARPGPSHHHTSRRAGEATGLVTVAAAATVAGPGVGAGDEIDGGRRRKAAAGARLVNLGRDRQPVRQHCQRP
ncbi:SDR family NAD(P)-dependent oxidoreductase [Mycobacterium lentiflavum]|uniref:SDR family NAD(P)-dependent oxidoreductase n=1 Tax=Mycobacterium lentiflavum TaxID=141349 RepID=A0ABY3UM00_MYCLN|nr:SDR family NAD(P)-dependent oxidoreductase [Mycobacterium lentiflavum]ULP40627.1 SDR family NAD(P)-dependent oxidoreductase [Mycobacterium lentiflavum]